MSKAQKDINAAAEILIAWGYKVMYDHVNQEFDIFAPGEKIVILDPTCPVEALHQVCQEHIVGAELTKAFRAFEG